MIILLKLGPELGAAVDHAVGNQRILHQVLPLGQHAFVLRPHGAVIGFDFDLAVMSLVQMPEVEMLVPIPLALLCKDFEALLVALAGGETFRQIDVEVAQVGHVEKRAALSLLYTPLAV